MTQETELKSLLTEQRFGLSVNRDILLAFSVFTGQEPVKRSKYSIQCDISDVVTTEVYYLDYVHTFHIPFLITSKME